MKCISSVLLQIASVDELDVVRARWELHGDAEDRVDELALCDGVAFGYPADLPFADGMHRLIARDRSVRTLDRSESEARRNALLDEAMVLLDDVVQIRRSSAPTAWTEFARLLQFGNRAGIRRMPVNVDYSRARSPAGECQAQEQLRRNQTPLRRQHELDRLAGGIDRTI